MSTYLKLMKFTKLKVTQNIIGKRIYFSPGCKAYKREVTVKLLKATTCVFGCNLTQPIW